MEPFRLLIDSDYTPTINHPPSSKIRVVCNFYLRQGVYVTVVVCLSVCLSVSTGTDPDPDPDRATLVIHVLVWVCTVSALYTPWVKKGCHSNHGYNFVNSWSICKILSRLQTAVNFQQNSYWVTHHTLSMLPHYLAKLKNHKFALCMHVKHISSVLFYHLSNRYLIWK